MSQDAQDSQDSQGQGGARFIDDSAAVGQGRQALAGSQDAPIEIDSDDDPREPAGRPGGRRGRGDFRVCAKQFALTYPQCPVDRAVFDPAFRLKFRPHQLASAREQHQDGSFHLHLYVEYASRRDVRSARHFDVVIDGQTYHPNIQRVKNRQAWLDYISKGGDHGVGQLTGDLEFDPLSQPLGKRKSAYQDYLWSRQFAMRRGLKPVAFPVALRTERETLELLRPDPRQKKRSWWIVAPPNAGKTRWLNRTFAGQRIYAPRTGPYPFEGYDDEDVIVYDDRQGVAFEEFASVLNTWDILMPVAGQVRYVTQHWKIGHTRSIIVLSNKTIEESMKEEDHQRMKKRFIQIVNPKLLLDDEVSSDDEEQKQAEVRIHNEFAS